MNIRSGIADTLRQQVREYGKPLAQFSEDFDIPLTSLKSYVRGDTNLRADSIDLLAEKLGITPAVLISGPSPSQKTENMVFRAADLFICWPREQQEQLISILQTLVQFLAENMVEVEQFLQ